MQPTLIFDTGVASTNLGDAIIMDYANKILEEILPENHFIHLTTHDYLGRYSKGLYRRSDYKILCGTNLLSGKMHGKTSQWKLDIVDYMLLHDVIFMGVGWKEYEGGIDYYTRKLLDRICSKDKMLSVRDSYTENKLKSIGINNVINTSCHTTWKLTPDFCKDIPIKKGKNVITTVTDYRKDPKADKMMLDILCNNYETVYLWIQSFADQEYLKQIFNIDRLKLIPPSLSAYDNMLKKDDLDYVGTRLHAGIRALNNKKRTLIVEVDNRAKEIAKDININTILRENFEDSLEDRIRGDLIQDIKIPINNINEWKGNFIR